MRQTQCIYRVETIRASLWLGRGFHIVAGGLNEAAAKASRLAPDNVARLEFLGVVYEEEDKAKENA